MADEIIINSLAQFVEVISAIEPDGWSELFFRGHANCEFQPEPGIFRENGRFLEYEKKLFNDLITQCPEEFKDCHYTFEYLVKMQHYGLPTRLLDITSNALVALYFACCDDAHNDQDGQVLVFEVLKDMIKNYNSDTVSVLSNLAHLKDDFTLFTEEKQEFLEEVEGSDDELCGLVQSFYGDQYYDQDLDKLLLIIQDSQRLSIIKTDYKKEGRIEELAIIELLESVHNVFVKDTQRKADNFIDIGAWILELQMIQDEKQRFLHFIKQEKSYFIDKLFSKQSLQRIVCVRAKLNNPRIIRQNGLFLLFGMRENKYEPITLSDHEGSIREHPSSKIIIAAKAKETIIQQLRAFGISQETLMPEIETVAKSLKENLYKRP